MSSKTTSILYWGTTVLFAAFMALSAVGHLQQDQFQIDMFRQLGYPAHVLITLGVAKLLGAIVLVLPRLRILKEWAYAGFTFDLLGASTAIFLTSMDIVQTLFPLVFFILLVPSYLLWKKRTNQPLTL